jgi:hypothetical protein
MALAYQKLEGNFLIVVIGVIDRLLKNGSNVKKMVHFSGRLLAIGF